MNKLVTLVETLYHAIVKQQHQPMIKVFVIDMLSPIYVRERETIFSHKRIVIKDVAKTLKTEIETN